MRSELASRFSTTGAARAVEATRAVKATVFKENFIVEDGDVVEGVEGGGKEGG